MTNDQKLAGLEEVIGARGSAEIHSGKRSALRAWLMAYTGRTAASILYLGTAELGAIYNDTTNAKADALKRNEDHQGGNGGGQTSNKGAGAQGETAGAQGETADQGKGETADQGKGETADQGKGETADQGEGEGDTPPPAPTNADGLPLVEVFGHNGETYAQLVAHKAPETVKARYQAKAKADAERFKKLAREEIKTALEAYTPTAQVPAPQSDKYGPERVVIVRENAQGEETSRTVAGLQHRMTPLILAVVRAGLTPALVGAAGGGKTHVAHAVAKALYQGRWELQGACNTKTDIVGFIDGHGKYQSTPFSRSFTGGGVFLADEMDSWNPNALLALNAALANGSCSLPTGMTERAPDWAPIVAMNTYGLGASRQYVGRIQLDAATLNRLAFIAWDYDEALEGALVGVKVKGLGPIDLEEGGIPSADEWLKRVHAVRRAVESLKVRHIVSPRATLGGVKLFAQGVGQKWVEDMLIWQGMDSEQRARIENAAKGAR